jgi:hypothetical protein
MFRSDNNDNSGATGNYYYLDVDGSGKSSVIRFFEPAVGDEPIMIASTGGIVDSPNTSTFQQIETLAGQIDKMIPTLADVAGVPEGDFQSAPNNVDLKQFGDKLAEVDRKVDTGSETVTEYVETATKVKYQRKSFVGPSSTDGIKIQFNNLEIGKTYRVTGFAEIFLNNDGSNVSVLFNNGVTQIAKVRWDGPIVDFGNALTGMTGSITEVFIATDTVFTVVTSNFAGIATRVLEQTNATLEELPNHEETTQWT